MYKRSTYWAASLAAAALLVSGGLYASQMAFKNKATFGRPPTGGAVPGGAFTGINSFSLPCNRIAGLDTAFDLIQDVGAQTGVTPVQVCYYNRADGETCYFPPALTNFDLDTGNRCIPADSTCPGPIPGGANPETTDIPLPADRGGLLLTTAPPEPDPNADSQCDHGYVIQMPGPLDGPDVPYVYSGSESPCWPLTLTGRRFDGGCKLGNIDGTCFMGACTTNNKLCVSDGDCLGQPGGKCCPSNNQLAGDRGWCDPFNNDGTPLNECVGGPRAGQSCDSGCTGVTPTCENGPGSAQQTQRVALADNLVATNSASLLAEINADATANGSCGSPGDPCICVVKACYYNSAGGYGCYLPPAPGDFNLLLHGPPPSSATNPAASAADGDPVTVLLIQTALETDATVGTVNSCVVNPATY